MRNITKRGLVISTMIGAITMSSLPAFAEVTHYITEKNGVKYEYTKDDLLNSIMSGTAQYERYKIENLYAVKDSVQGHIDIEDVMTAIMLSDGNFDVDVYTESKGARKIVLTDIKKVDKDGVSDSQTDSTEDFKVTDIQ